MKNYSQNLKEVQKALLRLIEDEVTYKLVKHAARAYMGLPLNSKIRQELEDEVDYLVKNPESPILYKAGYPWIDWLGAYILYKYPEVKKIVEEFIALDRKLKSQREKIAQLHPKYIELKQTISELEEEANQIDKKISRIDKRIYKLEIELDSVYDEIKRNKLINNIESLKEERDNLAEIYDNIYKKLMKLKQSNVIREYDDAIQDIYYIERQKSYTETELIRTLDFLMMSNS